MNKPLSTKRKIAKVIRERRRELEITQRSLAESIGYCASFVCQLEGAKCSLPAECVPDLSNKLRFKSVSDFWQKVLSVEVDFADDGWSS